MIHAEGGADLETVKTAVSMLSGKATTFIGEDADLLAVLLHYTFPRDGTKP